MRFSRNAERQTKGAHNLIVVVLVARDGLDPLQPHRHGERVHQLDAVLLGGTQIGQLGEEAEDRFVDASYQPAIDRDPECERRDALRSRLDVMFYGTRN